MSKLHDIYQILTTPEEHYALIVGDAPVKVKYERKTYIYTVRYKENPRKRTEGQL